MTKIKLTKIKRGHFTYKGYRIVQRSTNQPWEIREDDDTIIDCGTDCKTLRDAVEIIDRWENEVKH